MTIERQVLHIFNPYSGERKRSPIQPVRPDLGNLRRESWFSHITTEKDPEQTIDSIHRSLDRMNLEEQMVVSVNGGDATLHLANTAILQYFGLQPNGTQFPSNVSTHIQPGGTINCAYNASDNEGTKVSTPVLMRQLALTPYLEQIPLRAMRVELGGENFSSNIVCISELINHSFEEYHRDKSYGSEAIAKVIGRSVAAYVLFGLGQYSKLNSNPSQGEELTFTERRALIRDRQRARISYDDAAPREQTYSSMFASAHSFAIPIDFGGVFKRDVRLLRPEEGKVNLLVCNPRQPLSYLKLMLSAMTEGPVTAPGVQNVQTGSFSFTNTMGRPLSICMDSEIYSGAKGIQPGQDLVIDYGGIIPVAKIPAHKKLTRAELREVA